MEFEFRQGCSASAIFEEPIFPLLTAWSVWIRRNARRVSEPRHRHFTHHLPMDWHTALPPDALSLAELCAPLGFFVNDLQVLLWFFVVKHRFPAAASIPSVSPSSCLPALHAVNVQWLIPRHRSRWNEDQVGVRHRCPHAIIEQCRSMLRRHINLRRKGHLGEPPGFPLEDHLVQQS